MAFVKGIDVSYCQRGLDYQAVKDNGVKFAIIRAGFSLTEDTQLKEHIAECERYGIDYGFYWYSYAENVSDAKKEAAACLKALSGIKPAYPVFYDMEEDTQARTLSRAQLTDMAQAFCDAVRAGGLPCGIYANPSWLECYYDKSRLVGKYDIWLAHWTNDPDCPSKYDYGQTMWQWGIDRIGMDVDGDICFTDYPLVTKKWYAEHNISVEKSAAPENTVPAFSKGDKVRVKRGAVFCGGVKPFSWVYDTVFTVYGSRNCGEELMIGLSGEITGWISSCDALPESCVSTALKLGDKVKVRRGATDYNGGGLAAFVYDNTYTVMQVGTATRPDYIVIGVNGEVTAAVKESDLIKE